MHSRLWKEDGEKLSSYLVKKGLIACGFWQLGRVRKSQGGGRDESLKGGREKTRQDLKGKLSLAHWGYGKEGRVTELLFVCFLYFL